jgi:hypothetical protein
MKQWISPFLCLGWCVIMAASGFAQHTASTDTTHSRPAYIAVSAGYQYARFRDFATSPLFYSGNAIYTSLAHIDRDAKRESSFTASYATGTFVSDFNESALESKVHTISLNFLELFQLPSLSTSRFNLKVGGQLNATMNIRNNEKLLNNSEGVDLISNLFASVKGTLDVSRKKTTEKKFLFIRYKAEKRVRKLSFNLNIGCVNSSYRNGFAYTSSSAPINDDDFFSDYTFRIFRGFRLNTALDYTVWLKNKNAVQFSYLWDAYRSGGHHDNFEMATHVLKCSLLFGLK